MQCEKFPTEQSILARTRKGRFWLNRLHAYLLTIQNQVVPNSQSGQAIAYALKNWTALTRYCNNGDLATDNNDTERSLRGFMIGRNNWKFFGSDTGGKTAAVLRSFITSCEPLKIDPFAWFRDVLSRIADHPVKRPEARPAKPCRDTLRRRRKPPRFARSKKAPPSQIGARIWSVSATAVTINHFPYKLF
jgi:transposase